MEKVITDCKFFHSQLDTAIFDDPVRIYFSRKDEEAALKVFVQLKKQLEENESLKDLQRKSAILYILLQPNEKGEGLPCKIEKDIFDNHIVFSGTGNWDINSSQNLIEKVQESLPQIH